MRFPLLLFFTVVCCCAAPREGFVAFRMDLMRVPGTAERNPDKAIRHADTRCVMTVVMSVLSGSRAEVRLYDRFGSAFCGFSTSATPEVHIPRKSALIDYAAFYRMPEGGIFNGAPEKDFDSAVTMSSRRLLRVPKPASTGLFAMPGEGAVVPLLRLDTLYPFYGAVAKPEFLECRLLSVSSEELRGFLEKKNIPVAALEDPLPPEDAVTAFAAHPEGISFRIPVVRGRGDFQSDRQGISASVRALAGNSFRLTVSEIRTVGERDGIPVREEFRYEGFLAASPRWMMVVRLISPHAGDRALFEQEKNGRKREKLLLIRAVPVTGSAKDSSSASGV